jgi:hypothetical protein
MREGTHVLPCEQPTSEGRIRNDLDAELARGGEQPDLGVLDVERKRRIFDLHGRNRVDRVCAAESLSRNL